jgi:hypothetical protein
MSAEFSSNIRHAELVSASILLRDHSVQAAQWTLKQVQGDEGVVKMFTQNSCRSGVLKEQDCVAGMAPNATEALALWLGGEAGNVEDFQAGFGIRS